MRRILTAVAVTVAASAAIAVSVTAFAPEASAGDGVYEFYDYYQRLEDCQVVRDTAWAVGIPAYCGEGVWFASDGGQVELYPLYIDSV